jgi:hypothetical protein
LGRTLGAVDFLGMKIVHPIQCHQHRAA